MNVLITGGTGTISSGIAKESVKQGHNTYAITRGNHNSRNVKGVRYIQADVWNKEQIKKIMKDLDIDIVVECLVYNCEQLKISLENFSDKCKQYIFISTAGIFNREQGRVSENTKKDVIEWRYTRNKIKCEEYLKKYFKNRKNKFTIIRPFVTYGDYRVPFPITSRENQWTIFERIKNSCPIVACDNVKFAIIHIEDFSYGVVCLFNNKLAFNEDFNIAESNKEVYWDDILNLSGKILNKKINIIHIPLDVFKKVFIDIYDELKWNKTEDLLADDKKIKTVVNDFTQSITIEEGLKSTIKSLENEYKTSNKILDMKWWYRCDLALIYSYLKNELNNEEKAIVKNYIKSISLRDKFKILWYYIESKLKNIKRRLKL